VEEEIEERSGSLLDASFFPNYSKHGFACTSGGGDDFTAAMKRDDDASSTASSTEARFMDTTSMVEMDEFSTEGSGGDDTSADDSQTTLTERDSVATFTSSVHPNMGPLCGAGGAPSSSSRNNFLLFGDEDFVALHESIHEDEDERSTPHETTPQYFYSNLTSRVEAMMDTAAFITFLDHRDDEEDDDDDSYDDEEDDDEDDDDTTTHTRPMQEIRANRKTKKSTTTTKATTVADRVSTMEAELSDTSSTEERTSFFRTRSSRWLQRKKKQFLLEKIIREQEKQAQQEEQQKQLQQLGVQHQQEHKSKSTSKSNNKPQQQEQHQGIIKTAPSNDAIRPVKISFRDNGSLVGTDGLPSTTAFARQLQRAKARDAAGVDEDIRFEAVLPADFAFENQQQKDGRKWNWKKKQPQQQQQQQQSNEDSQAQVIATRAASGALCDDASAASDVITPKRQRIRALMQRVDSSRRSKGCFTNRANLQHQKSLSDLDETRSVTTEDVSVDDFLASPPRVLRRQPSTETNPTIASECSSSPSWQQQQQQQQQLADGGMIVSGAASKMGLGRLVCTAGNNKFREQEVAPIRSMDVRYNEFGTDPVQIMRVHRHDSLRLAWENGNNVCVRVEASTISEKDCRQRSGEYAAELETFTHFPIIPGRNFVGRVHLLRNGNETLSSLSNESTEQTPLRLGDRVLSLLPQGGGNARHAFASSKRLVRVPESLIAPEVVCLLETYLPAFQALHMKTTQSSKATTTNGVMEERYERGSLARRSLLIVGGAFTNNLGHALVELARNAGISKIYAVCKERQRELAKQWNVIPLSRKEHDWINPLQGSLDFVIDVGGGGSLKDMYQLVLNETGTYVVIGKEPFATASGRGSMSPLPLSPGKQVVAALASSKLICKKPTSSLSSPRSSLALVSITYYDIQESWKDQFELCKHDLHHLMVLLHKSRIKPKLVDSLPLSKVPKAHELLDTKRVEGVMVCDPWMKKAPSPRDQSGEYRDVSTPSISSSRSPS